MPTEFKDSDQKFRVGDLIKVRPESDYSGFTHISRNAESGTSSWYTVNHDSVLLVIEIYTGDSFGGEQDLYKCIPVGSDSPLNIPQKDIHYFMHTNE